jgi:hypothetical protein
LNDKGNSPFTPGSPVPVELFVGRSRQIEELRRYIRQTAFGRQENLFLAGDRGIGKSSLASFLRYLVISQDDILGIHVFLGGVASLQEMVRRIFDQLLKETRKESWFDKIKSFFDDYVREVGLFGVSVTFTPSPDKLDDLVRNFPEALAGLLEELRGKKGLFIALDDINGLAEREEFANWYKSFVDKIGVSQRKLPVSIMLIGLPEKRDSLSKLQPSLMRIFRVVEIDKLSNEEVQHFISEAFRRVDIRVEPKAMNTMVTFSSGLPVLMHEIGDATFWLDDDGVVSEKDASLGVFQAADNVGKKYLDPKFYRAVRSEHYKSIINKLPPLSRYFTKRDVETKLSEEEKRVFHNFITKLIKLGIIEHDLDKGRGSYCFVNEIYPVYIWLQSGDLKQKEEARGKAQ